MMIRWGVIVGLAVSAGAACRAPVEESPQACLSIAAGGADGTRGTHYLFATALARLFNERALGPCAAAAATDGSTFNVSVVDEADADFGIARADTVYTAYVEGTPLRPSPHTRLRGVAILYGSVLHLVVRAGSPVGAWTELRDAPVGLSVSATDITPVVNYDDLVAAAGDLGPGRVRGVRLPLSELSDALAGGQIAAAFVLTAYPMASLSELGRAGGVRLLEVEPDAAARIRARYPFFKPTLLPAGVYAGQDDPVRTVAVENLLVARQDLGEQAVYLLTRTLLENLPRLARDHAAALQVNPDLAPATPIPLHPGAARYYRERELLR